MNASAPALPREDEVQSKIRKVRQFGRIARFVCAAIFGFGLVGTVAVLVIAVPTNIPGPIKGNGGAWDILNSLFNPYQVKLFAALGVSALAGVWLASVYQLYRLFGDLAVGVIYTPENVRRVRHVGLLLLLLAVLMDIVIPAAFVVAHGYIEPSIRSISIACFLRRTSCLATSFRPGSSCSPRGSWTSACTRKITRTR